MEFTLKQEKTFRYEILNGSAQAKTVLYVLHGYGQLVKFFIQKFKTLDKDVLIVAPEGMHRFYLRGTSGRVGASWMTKEAREIDIQDNLNYLNKIDYLISSEFPIVNRHLLGFSQGGATALRWKMDQTVQFNSTIIWGSDFPREQEWPIPFKREKKNYFLVGDEDEFFNDETRSQLTEYYLSLGFNIEIYAGKHDIEIKTLQKLLAQIKSSVLA